MKQFQKFLKLTINESLNLLTSNDFSWIKKRASFDNFSNSFVLSWLKHLDISIIENVLSYLGKRAKDTLQHFLGTHTAASTWYLTFMNEKMQ